MTQIKYKYLKNRFIYNLIIFGLILIMFGILAPIIFNRPAPSWFSDKYFFEEYYFIGQNFGNYFMPFVALLGAVLTFCAFYVQFQANQSIKEQFTQEQNNAHFYEMLKIHIDNVKEFKITSFYKTQDSTHKCNFIVKQ